MTIHLSRAFLLTLAAIALVTLGAVGAWAVNKAITPPMVTPVPQPIVTPTTAPLPVAPTVPSATTAPTTTTVEIKTQTATTVQPGYFLAEIIKVRRHYVRKTIPYRACYSEPRTVMVQDNQPSGMGAVIGGAAGGLLGNQVGQGRGNIAATIGGAVLGAVAGHQVESNMDRPQQRVIYNQVCRTKYRYEAVPSGYEVTYLDHAHTRTIITKQAPKGDTISVPTVVDVE